MFPRQTFLGHFLICLSCAAAASFAAADGVFVAVWEADQSMMTSATAALFLGTAAWLGRQAWLAEEPPAISRRGQFTPKADASFGHLAERLLPMLGLFGTAFGLSLQAKALSGGGGAAFLPLATSLYTTACGVLGALIVAAMTFNLEAGLRRAGHA